MTEWDLAGALRRIRRRADMSQREIAVAGGVSPSVIAKAEAEARDLPVRLLARLAGVAGLRLALLDPDGAELTAMSRGAVRDAAGRLFPAHLDTRHGDEHWWGGPHRPRLAQPRYTFDRDRNCRDDRRGEDGTAADHHTPEPGDSLAERAAARRAAAVRRAAQERERRFRDGTLGRSPDPFTCTCPPDCEYDEERNPDMTHTPACACRCDVS